MAGETLRIGDLEIDVKLHQVVRNTQRVRLTRIEWGLLEELVLHADTVLPSRVLLERVWGPAYFDAIDTLRVHIGNLRRKLEDDPSAPKLIVTEPGIGYRLVTSTDLRTPSQILRLRHHVPTPLTSFIGREREVIAVCDALLRDDVRLLTLVGPGGVGKTRLAIQVARELRDDFPDGVWFISFAQVRDSCMVLAAVRQVLGVEEEAGQPLVTTIASALSGKQLLVLDNFEHIVAAAPAITELLTAAPQLKILVTSRVVLHVYGEHEFVVSPLQLPSDHLSFETLAESPAVMLFETRARAVTPDFRLNPENAATVAAICAQLDGLPLAIELAAGRSKIFTPQVLLERLGQRLAVLIAGGHDLPPRQRSLRDTLDWSYHLLDMDEQRLFARLALFVGGCTREAAVAVCNGSGDLMLDIEGGIESLVGKSLLQQHIRPPDELRFTMLETIREYALERLADFGDVQLIRRNHAEYYVTFAEQAAPKLNGGEQREWLHRLGVEYDNICAALRWSTQQNEAELAVRLCLALADFWNIRSYIHEGLVWCESVLAIDTLQREQRATILNRTAGLAFKQVDLVRAQRFLEESLAIWRELGDSNESAKILSNLGSVCRAHRDLDAARRLYQESLTTWSELGYPEQIACVLNNLGLISEEQGDLDAARRLYQESLAIWRELGPSARPDEIARILNNLGTVIQIQGDYNTALELYEESLRLFWELEDTGNIAMLLESFADLLLEQPFCAVVLCAAGSVLRTSVGASREHIEQARIDRVIASARANLGESLFVTAWTTGTTMTMEQAVMYALQPEARLADSRKHVAEE